MPTQPSPKKYFSVTFEVHDEDKFKTLAAQFSGGMLGSPEQIAERGYDVSACGWGDMATQADCFQRVLEEMGHDPMDELIVFLSEEGEGMSGEEAGALAKQVMG